METENKKLILYTIFIIIALISLSFLGYYYGFLGAIYKVIMPQAFSQFNIIMLSIVFGIAAFFSPCAFTVLPAYVSNYLSKEEVKKPPFSKLFRLGSLAALGIILVNMVMGTAIAILGSATPFSKDPRTDIPLILGIRVAAGFFIAILGVMTLMHKSFNIGFIQNFLSRKNFTKSIFWYGVIYNAAALGCTGPIMLGLMLYAYASGSFTAALTSFVVFSLTMGFLMISLTVLTGLFKSIIIKKIVGITPIITKIAGVIMILVGLTIAFLTLEGNKLFVKLFFPFLD